MSFDIHTHKIPRMADRAILNVSPSEFAPQEGGLYSVGIHPWQVGKLMMQGRLQEEKELLAGIVRHPQVVAVGEAGLDKLAEASPERQSEVFQYQAGLAEEVQKPLIIHLVRATEELLKVKREVRPVMPWVIHGFRGKESVARELLKHGFFLSFGEKFQEAALSVTPLERLLLETDESTLPIEILYARVAALRGISEAVLREEMEKNVKRLFVSSRKVCTFAAVNQLNK